MDALRQFVEREGHARPQKRHVEDDHDLGMWVSQQRMRYWRERELNALVARRGTEDEQEGDERRIAEWEDKRKGAGKPLTDSQIAELEALPGWRWTITQEDMQADFERGIRERTGGMARRYSEFAPHESEAPRRHREPDDPPRRGLLHSPIVTH